MKSKVKEIPIDLISENMTYSEESPSGLVWSRDIVMPCNAPTLKKGENVGCKGDSGYWQISFKGKLYSTHRVIWTLFNGQIPEGLVINHIDCNRGNNKLSNLEIVTIQQNSRKTKMHVTGVVSKLNTSGINGVYEEKTWNGTKTKLNYYARAYWHNAEGKAQRKSFAYSKYGKEKAWELAAEFVKLARGIVDVEVDNRERDKLQNSQLITKRIVNEDDQPRLLVNRWMCPDGTILQSKHRYDYIDYVDKNNQYYSVDGGTLMSRVSGELTSLCLYTDDEHAEIRMFFCWGSFLKDYRNDKVWIPLFKLGDSHIQAIIETQKHIPAHIKELFLNEVEYRKQHGITVEETTKE